AVGRVIAACLSSTRRKRDSYAASLGVIVDGLAARDPDNRYPDARALLKELERVRDGSAPLGPGAYERTRHVATIIGRSRELERLAQVWGRVGANDGGVVVVRGRRGGGKTHFLTSAVNRARLGERGRIAHVAAREGDAPLATLRRLISTFAAEDELPSALKSDELLGLVRLIAADR